MAGPIRTCRMCGLKTTKDKLQRYVWRQGEPQLDVVKKMDGRGVYCCGSGTCIERFMKQKKKWKIYFRL